MKRRSKKFHTWALALLLSLALGLGLLPHAALAADDPFIELGKLDMNILLSTQPEKAIPPRTLEQAEHCFSEPTVEWFFDESKEDVFQQIVQQTERLIQGKKSDTAKARAIYQWVANNITYDYTAFDYNNELGAISLFPEDEKEIRVAQAGDPFCVYYNRRGVCGGYARLSNLMLTIAGLPSAHIGGIDHYNTEDHAWNAVYADGKWIFFDATWSEWDMSPTYHRHSAMRGIYYRSGHFDMGIDVWLVGGVSCCFAKGHDCPDTVVIPDDVVMLLGFEDCTGLTHITIPDSVIVIGSDTFKGCTSLTNITIPDSVTTIGYNAFEGCTSLTNITIPDSVTDISGSLFKNCISLAHITIPDSVTEIWNNAFEGCTSLTHITIPDSVTEIGSYAFKDCINLTSVTVGDGVTEIGGNAFDTNGDTPPTIYGVPGSYVETYAKEHSIPFVDKTGAVSGQTATENLQTVKVDGKDVTFAMYSPDNGATNYVRLRDLAVALNGTTGQYNVGYDKKLDRVLLTAGEAYEGPADVAPFHEALEYELTKEATYVNGTAQNLEALRFEYQGGGYTYYKLRDLGEALGFNVGWDRAGKYIYIESGKPYDPNN